MIETARRRVLDTLNSRYIYGRVVRTFLQYHDFMISLHLAKTLLILRERPKQS